MATGVPERLRWAVELLDPQGPDHVLEVGCGHGVAAGLICARLTSGLLLAVDRSETALERAASRNAIAIASGRLVVQRGEIAKLEGLDRDSFDSALAINVNLFWTSDPAPELTVLRRALRPGGRLLLLWGVGDPTGPDRILPVVERALEGRGFPDVRRVHGAAGFGVVAV